MLSSVSEIINEVLVRNNRTTTDGFITDDMLEDWLREANAYCSAARKWPLSEVRDQTLSWSGAEELPYSSFGIDFKADSIRILQIGGKRLRKTAFEEYQTQREEFESSTERMFTDFGYTLFINPNADVSGTITAWGQYIPTIDSTDASATTIFSSFDTEGNEAIVEKMTSYMKRREHLPDEAELHDQRTDLKLEQLWNKIQAEAYKYHSGRESEGMWARFDTVDGYYADEGFKRDQFT